MFEPSGKKWGGSEKESEYFAKAYADMYSKTGLRAFVYYDDFNWRWMGYGTGGDLMQRYALKNPMNFTSLVVVNGSDNISQAYLDEAGATCFTNAAGHIFDWPNSKIPVPVWLISKKATSGNQKVINYWKTANDCLDTKIQMADKTYKYVQDPLSGNLMTYDQKVGQVVVTEKNYSYTDTSLTKAAYDFLRQFARTGLNSPYSSMLTSAADDSRFTRETINVDGVTREWYTSLPSKYTGEEAMPLVIYFHGAGQTGLMAMRQGDWWKYGETQGFITVCPSGSLGAAGLGSTAGAIPIVTWKTGASPAVDEIVFVRAMIDKLESEYNIDASRIYITGQSNGCMMTQMVAEKAPELFAAAAATGTGPTAQTELATFILQGEFDLTSPGLTEDGQLTNTSITDPLKALLLYHGLDYDNASTFENGIFYNFEWDDGAGTPVFRYCVARGCAHSWRQNEVEMFWDEWFCRFSRDTSTGELLYMGK